MKKRFLVLVGLAAVSLAPAQNVPSGLTGLWRFQNSANYGAATVGSDIVFSATYGALMGGPITAIGTVSAPNLYTDSSVFQESSWNYMSVYHGISANGGGSYINEYTIALDYRQTQTGWNSLVQTAWDGNANDGDLFIDGTTAASSTIGIGAVGYSSLTFDSSQWHRIVLSVDNGNFFRVYVDGTLFLDGAGQGIDGRFALELDRVNLFADNSWEDMWGLVGTVAVWDHALTSTEVAGMGGWIGGASTPTALTAVPEPTAMSLLALGGLLGLIRRNRK